MEIDGFNLLMALAGETPDKRLRTKNAIGIHNLIGPVHGAKIPLYFAGSHSGLMGTEVPEGGKPYCLQARDYALSQGINDEDIIVERPRQGVGSLDTVANFVYAQDIVPRDFTRVGLFTEEGHMRRSLWLAEKVFVDKAIFEPFPSEPDVLEGKLNMKIEDWTYNFLRHDLKDITDGDSEALQRYMEHVHPFHAPTYGNHPKFSRFLLLVYAGKIKNALSGESKRVW